MAKVLGLLRDEHRSIAAVLHGMEFLMNEMREHGAKVDLKVFWAMLYYLDTFSGRIHHPREDEYLFKRVRAFEENRDPLAAERQTKDIQRLFRRIVELAPPPIGVGPGVRSAAR